MNTGDPQVEAYYEVTHFIVHKLRYNSLSECGRGVLMGTCGEVDVGGLRRELGEFRAAIRLSVGALKTYIPGSFAKPWLIPATEKCCALGHRPLIAKVVTNSNDRIRGVVLFFTDDNHARMHNDAATR